jgi:hypothetical protein
MIKIKISPVKVMMIEPELFPDFKPPTSGSGSG